MCEDESSEVRRSEEEFRREILNGKRLCNRYLEKETEGEEQDDWTLITRRRTHTRDALRSRLLQFHESLLSIDEWMDRSEGMTRKSIRLTLSKDERSFVRFPVNISQKCITLLQNLLSEKKTYPQNHLIEEGEDSYFFSTFWRKRGVCMILHRRGEKTLARIYFPEWDEGDFSWKKVIEILKELCPETGSEELTRKKWN